jgi:hypothetical protein
LCGTVRTTLTYGLTHLSSQQAGRAHAQHRSDPADDEKARIATAAFDATEIGKVDLRLERELLLRQRTLPTKPSHIFS